MTSVRWHWWVCDRVEKPFIQYSHLSAIADSDKILKHSLLTVTTKGTSTFYISYVLRLRFTSVVFKITADVTITLKINLIIAHQYACTARYCFTISVCLSNAGIISKGLYINTELQNSSEKWAYNSDELQKIAIFSWKTLNNVVLESKWPFNRHHNRIKVYS